MSPDGSRIAIFIVNGKNVEIRNADTGLLMQTLDANNPIQELAFSPGGHQIIGVDQSGQVEVWDRTNTTPRMLGAPGPTLSDVAYDQSGQRVRRRLRERWCKYLERKERACAQANQCVPVAQQRGIQP